MAFVVRGGGEGLEVRKRGEGEGGDIKGDMGEIRQRQSTMLDRVIRSKLL